MTIQTNFAGELTHLLTLEGMPKEQIPYFGYCQAICERDLPCP